MTVIKKDIVVPYSTQQMFELVTQMESYPEFIAWCDKTIVHSRNQSAITASFYGHKLGIHFAFTTVNQLQANRLIDIHLMNTGPFRQIKASWRFDNVGTEGSRLSFELQYEFKNAFLGWTLSPIIKNEVNNFMQAIRQRSKETYGR